MGCIEPERLACFCGSTTRQVSIFFFLNVHFILPLELILSPLLLAYLLTGGFLLLKHKFYQFLCLDHRYCPGAK